MSVLIRGGRVVTAVVYTPPPRPKEKQELLWHALATDVLSVVSTDHCPFNWDGQKISAGTHHSNIDYNLYEGMEVVGAPEVVLVRGQIIVENDELVGEPGAGRFVRRARFGEDLR